MPTDIVILAENLRLEGYLTDTPTARALADALPFEAEANLWGDEIYFSVPVAQGLDDTAATVVNVGDLAYWPTGKAFCIFFGLTPSSVPGEIRPASAVNMVGKITGAPGCLKLVSAGATIKVERR